MSDARIEVHIYNAGRHRGLKYEFAEDVVTNDKAIRHVLGAIVSSLEDERLIPTPEGGCFPGYRTYGAIPVMGDKAK